MKILFIGDIFGNSGRRAVSELVNKLKQEENIDFVIANAENTSNGKGVSKEHFELLSKSGIDFFTMGNHTWDNLDIYDIFKNNYNIIRPGNVRLKVENDYANYSKLLIINKLKIRITNLMGLSVIGKRFETTSPFIFFKNFLNLNNIEKADIHIVDFHAESTAEKAAFFRMFDGHIDAVLGTHTHVQTNDASISKNNTAFITDVGLTGAANSIIGAEIKSILNYYEQKSDYMYIKSAKGKYQFCAVILTIDDLNKKVIDIEKIFIKEE